MSLAEIPRPDNASAIKILREVLELGDEIEHVIVLIQRRDGLAQTSMSDMLMSKACWLAKHLDIRITEDLKG